MKIMKNGTIEPCCDKAKEWIDCFCVYIHNEKNKVIEVTVLRSSDEYYDLPVDFCPFCGAKTEVEK